MGARHRDRFWVRQWNGFNLNVNLYLHYPMRWEFKKLAEEQVILEATVGLAYIVDRKLEKQNRQSMYHLTPRRIRATIVVVEKQ